MDYLLNCGLSGGLSYVVLVWLWGAGGGVQRVELPNVNEEIFC